MLASLLAAAIPMLAAGAADLDAKLERSLPGWTVDSKAEGDLDGDGVSDVAAILVKNAGGAKSDPVLAVWFGAADGSVRLIARAPKATCIGCGGVKAPMDEPLGALSIANGVLSLASTGGSREEWSSTYKFRWSAKARRLLLIGETRDTVDTLGEEPEESLDVNFSTRQAIRTVGKKPRRCAVPATFVAPSLDTFDFESFDDGVIVDACSAKSTP